MIFKRVSAFIICFIMLLCTVPVGAITIENDDNYDYESEGYSPDELVNVFVVLSDKPIADISYNVKSILTADSAREHLDKKQDSVFEKIKEIYPYAKEIARYKNVINGISVSVPYGIIDEIKEINGVADSFVAPEYKPLLTNSTSMIGANYSWKAGYSGKGSVIAVIDTGLLLSHEAFSVSPQQQKLSRTNVNNIVSSGRTIATGNVYKSGKVPFAFDYTQNSTDVSHGSSSDHGTHVAGIVAGNSNRIKGVAPDAQLAIMKVFSGSFCDFTAVAAALDDCAVLGVDVVSMSLGSTVTHHTVVSEAISNLKKLGINVVAGAGNDAHIASGNNFGSREPLTHPDLGMLLMPAADENAVAVASVNNRNSGSSYVIRTTGDSDLYISYNDGATSEDAFSTLSGENYDYVVIDNYGDVDDYKYVDVRGKIALVQRGDITFDEKLENAYNNGAVGCIVYNNSDSAIINMTISSYKIPTVMISKSDGERLINLADKRLFVEEDLRAASYTMATSSSWGVTEDLRLKPEITAPGGNIYSCYGNGGYGYMSGTSMATPHASASIALIRKHLEDTYNLSGTALSNAAEAVLMSTATPIINSGGIPYSPRKQGAGLINLETALKTGAYVTVNGSKPKIELYDDVNRTGEYKLSFTINNVSSKSVSYSISVDTITHSITSGSYIGLDSYRLYPTITGDRSVLVPANSKKTISLTLNLSQSDRAYLERFRNGMFVEGFVKLSETSGLNLSVPFMGFYGDWTSQHMFDELGNSYGWAQSGAYAHSGSDKYLLGTNPYSTSEDFDISKAAISPNGDGKADSIYQIAATLLRNSKQLRVMIYDRQDNVYFSKNTEYAVKTSAPFGVFKSYIFDPRWSGKNLDNGSVVYARIEADIDFDRHEQNESSKYREIPVYIDTQAPQITNYEIVSSGSRKTLKVSFKDNRFVAMCKVIASNSSVIATRYLNLDNPNQVSSYEFDITGYGDVKIMLADYAMNEITYDLKKGYDVNLDGKENTFDAVIILEYCAHLRSFDSATLNRADVNDDGTVDSSDATDILRKMAEY